MTLDLLQAVVRLHAMSSAWRVSAIALQSTPGDHRLSPELSADVLRDQAATAAVSLSSRTGRWQEFRDRIPDDVSDRLTPFVHGIALGWAARWND
jgi:hypothetical protein